MTKTNADAGLRISDDLTLPIDFVTSRQAILAKTRVGKSYTGQVQAEELLRLKQQAVVLDPTDVWYGLRSNAAGDGPGYPIAVFGGDHGDLELAPGSGAHLAEAVVKERFSAVFALSLFTPEQLATWVAAFCETFYRLNREPVHLFADEADAYASQTPESRAEHKSLAAMDRLVRRGGVKGIGCTLISQRAALLNKNLLSQVEMLTVLRMHHPLDLKPVRAWIKAHGDPEREAELITSLPALAKGHAWVWNPEIDLFRQIQVRRKRTYDSGRTPEAGKKATPPKILAPVDLARLGTAVAETIERQKANDPALLKKRVAELEAQVAKAARAPAPSAVTHAHVTTVSAAPAQIAKAVAAAKRVWWKEYQTQFKTMKALATGEIHKLAQGLRDAAEESIKGLHAVALVEPADPPSPAPPYEPNGGAYGDGRGEISFPVKSNVRRIQPNGPTVIDTAEAISNLPRRRPRDGSPQDRILGALAWWAALGVDEPTNVQVALVAGYSPNSSTYQNRRGEIRSLGLLEYVVGNRVTLTDGGRAEAPPVETPPTVAELHAVVLAQLNGPQEAILRPLLAAYPDVMTNEALAPLAGYSPNSSTYQNRRGEVRSLGLIEYARGGGVVAADILFSREQVMHVQIMITSTEIQEALVEYLVNARSVPREIAGTCSLQVGATNGTWSPATLGGVRAIASGSTNESFATGPYR